MMSTFSAQPFSEEDRIEKSIILNELIDINLNRFDRDRHSRICRRNDKLDGHRVRQIDAFFSSRIQIEHWNSHENWNQHWLNSHSEKKQKKEKPSPGVKGKQKTKNYCSNDCSTSWLERKREKKTDLRVCVSQERLFKWDFHVFEC